jgi:iron complex transport system ATP-binding protein
MNSLRSAGLSCRGLNVSVPGRSLVADLDLQVVAGEILAVLGPNGVGKSLTLHTLAGLRTPGSGVVELHGEPIASLRRQQVATRLALLPQYTEDVFPASVLDTVLIGRHPHIGRLQWESAADREVARLALREVDLYETQERNVATLSGGERRRLAVAQVLAQEPQIFLLDEPTNHLDPQHQLDMLRLFRRRADAGAAVLASLHDVNLAARFADRCLLLYGDGRWKIGMTSEVLSEDTLSGLYATPIESVGWRDKKLFVAVG